MAHQRLPKIHNFVINDTVFCTLGYNMYHPFWSETEVLFCGFFSKHTVDHNDRKINDAFIYHLN